MDAAMATTEDKLSLLWGSQYCRELCFVVERNAVHRQLGNASDRMMSIAGTTLGHAPEFVARTFTKETAYQPYSGDRLRFYLMHWRWLHVNHTRAYQTPMLQSSELYILQRY
jgi:hypothetical protein